MAAPLEAAEVTVVNADSWIDHAGQLALLLSRANHGEVIPDVEGNPADPERIIVLRGLPLPAERTLHYLMTLWLISRAALTGRLLFPASVLARRTRDRNA